MSILPSITEYVASSGGEVVKDFKEHEYKTRCPFCGDTGKHLQLNDRENIFFCYRCGESGGVIALAQQLRSMTKEEVIQEFRKVHGKETDRKVHPAMTIPPDKLEEYWLAPYKQAITKLQTASPSRAKKGMNWLMEEFKKSEKREKELDKALIEAIQVNNPQR